MASTVPVTTGYDEVLRTVRRARDRWRVGRALRGLALWIPLALVLVAIAAVALERLRFAEPAVLGARVLAWATLAASFAWLVLRPLLRRVSDVDAALHVEADHPALDAALVSAVEHGGAAPASATTSPALARRLVAQTMERTRALRAHETGRLQLHGSALAVGVLAVAAGLLLLLGPVSLREAARLLFVPWGEAQAAAAGLRIVVEPGNATVARGGDQQIVARLSVPADSVLLLVQRDSGGAWERLPMMRTQQDGAWSQRLFDLEAPVRYRVEAAGARTPVYTLAVADLPFVSGIDLVYEYPAHTGLAPDTVVNGGDIAAPRGTVVRLTARTTRPAAGGRMVIEGRDTIPLTVAAGGALEGEVRVMRAGFYRIELAGADGRMAPGSLDYTIDLLDDRPPSVRFVKPGRDVRVTALEEVLTQAEAEDDYGVARLELVYAVNGGEERTVTLRAGGPRRTEVSGTHTFFLEELALQPGDVVSYWARATDNDAVSGAKQATTDIYFLTVRPFDQEYRQGQGGAGAGGAGAESPGALSQRQREVVAATFRTLRDRARDGERRYRENVATLVLGQGTVRERVEKLAQQIQMRGIMGMDSTFRIIAEELPKAAEAMREAEARLAARDTRGALGPEQRALQHLQRAEAAFREVEISFSQGGGGGEGGEANVEDLADLFELENDKLHNQYETVPNAQREGASDREVDETLRRLRELAQRQQQANEELQRRLSQLQPPGGGGGGGAQRQRQLAQETEDLARRLERLARERRSESLAETARRLQDAANAMRQQAAGGERRSGAGTEALERLERARRGLEQERGTRAAQEKGAAIERAERIAAEQRAIQQEMQRLRGATDSAGMAQVESLAQRKERLAQEITGLEGDLERLARGAREGQPEAARRVQEAAQDIREARLPEKLRYSREALRRGAAEIARTFEPQLGEEIERMRRTVTGAVQGLGEPGERREARALERTRELVRDLESLADRTRARAEGSERPGAQGSPGQEAQSGQQGNAADEPQQGGAAQGGGMPAGGGPTTRIGAGAPGQGGPMVGGGRFTEEEMRQMRRELRERRGEAEALRRELARRGVDISGLDEQLARLRALENARVSDDPEELLALQAAVVDGLKDFEFTLRRVLGAQPPDAPALGRLGEVPPAWRRLVEQYYRELSAGERGEGRAGNAAP